MDEKKQAETAFYRGSGVGPRGSEVPNREAPTAAPGANAGQPEEVCRWCAAGEARVVSSLDPTGQTFIHQVGPDPSGRKVCAVRGPNVKSSLHSPVLTELSREEGAAKFREVESADYNASLPDWPRKDSLTGSKENLNSNHDAVRDAAAGER